MTDTDGIKYCLKPCLINAENILNAVKIRTFGFAVMDKRMQKRVWALSSSRWTDSFLICLLTNALEAMQKTCGRRFFKKACRQLYGAYGYKNCFAHGKSRWNEMFYDYALCECDRVDISELKKRERLKDW